MVPNKNLNKYHFMRIYDEISNKFVFMRKTLKRTGIYKIQSEYEFQNVQVYNVNFMTLGSRMIANLSAPLSYVKLNDLILIKFIKVV